MTSPSKEQTVLVLQGGGALGAYQAGAYEALAEADLVPDWVAGISIGAINAAIIAGNPIEQRVERLRDFWMTVSSGLQGTPFLIGERARTFFNEVNAARGAVVGVPGFFRPRTIPPLFAQSGSAEALSYYDTSPLRDTLAKLIDFDLIRTGATRLSVGAVNIMSGNFVYFDNQERAIGPDHIMASGALPPGFPPVMIDGEPYWDGGLVSNTPLQYVLDDAGPRHDMLVFQVDLFSARGPMPKTLADVAQRDKDIRYSSRTRLNTDVVREIQTLRRAASRLSAKLPKEFRNDADAKLLRQSGCDSAITIMHLINRQTAYETGSKDYEFSRLSVEEHWQAGGDDVRRSLADPAWKKRKRPTTGVTVLDLARDAPNKDITR
jgi:NTE family protein